MENMYLKHMTDAEKKIYNKNYYQRNKQYWVLWRAEHGQNGKQTGVPVAGKAQSLKGTRLSEEEIRKRKSDSYWDQYNKKAKLDYLKRNAQYEKEKWQKANAEIFNKVALRQYNKNKALKNEALARANASGNGRVTARSDSKTGASSVSDYALGTGAKLKGLESKIDVQWAKAIQKAHDDEAKAKQNIAEAQRRASNVSGRKRAVASLPASSAPGYSKYKNEIKPLLDQKLDALKYAANIAKEKTKEVLKSIWDLL